MICLNLFQTNVLYIANNTQCRESVLTPGDNFPTKCERKNEAGSRPRSTDSQPRPSFSDHFMAVAQSVPSCKAIEVC